MTISNLMSEDTNIGYYTGTFDPIHAGHYSLINAAVKNKKFDVIYVAVDDEDNPNKPLRLSWENRLHMVEKNLGTLDKVIVWNKGKSTLKEQLAGKNVSLIFGEDCLNFYFNKERVFKNLYVAKRSFEENCDIAIPNEYKIHFFTPEILGLSSTKIRKYLSKHPYLFEYKQTFLSDPFIEKNLHPEVANLIFENKHYYLDNQKRITSIKLKITKYVQNHFQNYTLSCLTDIGEGGRSGNLAFKISSENPTFIKVYVKPTQKQECLCEYEGITQLNAFNLKWCKSVKTIYWVEYKSHYSYMGVPLSANKDLSRVFMDLSSLYLQKNENFETKKQEFLQMCFYVGRGLSELHAYGSFPIVSTQLKKETDNLNTKARNCLAKIRKEQGDVPADQLSIEFERGFENFVKNPGLHAYVHDDANLGNFIVNMDEQTVTLIDLDRFHSMQTAQGEPLGFPAEDYHRFLNCLEWQSLFTELPDELIRTAQDQFIKGYQCFTSQITKEAHQYYANYWYLRNLVSKLELNKSAHINE